MVFRVDVVKHTERQSSASKDMTCSIVNIGAGVAQFLLWFGHTSKACSNQWIYIA